MDAPSPEPGSQGGSALLALGLIWLVGTPILLMFWFSYGFTLIGGTPTNATLSEICGIAASILGLGAPPVGFIASLVMGNKAGAWIYGVITVAVVALLIAVIPKDRGGPIRAEGQTLSIASPDKAVGAPDC